MSHPIITREMQLRELERIRGQAAIDDHLFVGPKWQPSILFSLPRLESAAEHFLDGLKQHYFACAAAGRLDQWKAAALGCIGLVADQPFATARREDLP